MEDYFHLARKHCLKSLYRRLPFLIMTYIPPTHPGEILLEEFLNPLRLTQYRLSKDIGVPPIRINEIIHGKRAISADTALRLGKYFSNTAEFWMNLQSHYDLERKKQEIGEILLIKVKVFQSEKVVSV